MTRYTVVFLLIVIGMAEAQQTTDPDDIPIQAFAQLPAMRNAELSPDGTHLAYFRPIKGRWNLIIQAMIGSQGQPVVVPPVGDLNFDRLHWANNERVVFTVSATRMRRITETTETRLWATNKDGSNLRHVVIPATKKRTGSSIRRSLPHAQIQSDVVDWLPEEPNHILLALNANTTPGDEVRRIDIRTGEYEIVQEDFTGIQEWMTDSTGRLQLGWGYRSTKFNMMTRDATGAWINAEKTDWWDDDIAPLAFTDSADIVYARRRGENGTAVIQALNIRSGEFGSTVYEQDGIDVNDLLLDPVTNMPAGISYIDDEFKIDYFDSKLAALQKGIDAALPGATNRITSMTNDRLKVLVHSSSDIDPGSYFFLDRDQGGLSFVAQTMPGLSPELMSTVEPVNYPARDGLTIPGYLTVPKGKARENLVVVVMPHGGPTSRSSKSFWFLTQFLASRGYAVFQPNFRGSSGYGIAFEEAGEHQWGGKMQEDVTDGTRWLIEQGIADGDNICIVGWSYGGYSAAMGAVQTPDLYQCAASINGVLDLPRLISDDRRYVGGSVWTKHVGLEGEDAVAVSPYHQAERIKVPMLIIQAEDDARVHKDQGARMANRLRKLKKPYEFIEIELGGHGMSNEIARQKILSSLEAFLAENLRVD